MQIEISEEAIKKAFEAAIEDTTGQVIRRAVSSWGFEDKVVKAVNSMMGEVINDAVTDQLQSMDEIKAIVHNHMVKSIKSKLERAIRAKPGE